MYLCLYLSLVPSLPLHLFSAGAPGHHLTVPANPCISFPIPIPAGLRHDGNEGTFALWLYIWFNSMITCVCVCVRARAHTQIVNVMMLSGQRPWPHPRDNGHSSGASLLWVPHIHACTQSAFSPLALRLAAGDGRHGDWFLVKCQWRWKYCPKAFSLSLHIYISW